MDLADRTALATWLSSDESLARTVTDALFVRHPDWTARFGARGRRRCTEDVRLHVAFLSGSVQAGTPQLFADYASWCATMLRSRGMEGELLAEHFAVLEEQLKLDSAWGALVHGLLDSARDSLRAAATTAPRDTSTPHQIAYLTAGLGGDRGAAWRVTRDAIRDGYSIGRVYGELIIGSQRRLGELWEEAKISVAQEHMASSVTQAVIARLYAEIDRPRTAGRALMAGVEGELHTLPAQLASDVLELEGWDVAYVGTNTPLEAVLESIEAEKPDLVGLSTTMPSSLVGTVQLVQAIRERFGALRVVLGGRAVRGADALARELGVEVVASEPPEQQGDAPRSGVARP